MFIMMLIDLSILGIMYWRHVIIDNSFARSDYPLISPAQYDCKSILSSLTGHFCMNCL